VDETTANNDDADEIEEISPQLSVKTERLTEWNATVILQTLLKVVDPRNEGNCL